MIHPYRILALLPALAAVLCTVTPVHANTLTASARKAAIQAHQYAAKRTQMAGRLQQQLAAKTRAFNAGMLERDTARRTAARVTYYRYLYSLRTSLKAADTAHAAALQRFRTYRRVSRNDAVLGTMQALSGARTRFAQTIADIDALMKRVAAIR